MERKVEITKIESLEKFYSNLINEPDLVFYNGNIYPKKEEDVVHIRFCRVEENPSKLIDYISKIFKKLIR